MKRVWAMYIVQRRTNKYNKTHFGMVIELYLSKPKIQNYEKHPNTIIRTITFIMWNNISIINIKP